MREHSCTLLAFVVCWSRVLQLGFSFFWFIPNQVILAFLEKVEYDPPFLDGTKLLPAMMPQALLLLLNIFDSQMIGRIFGIYQVRLPVKTRISLMKALILFLRVSAAAVFQQVVMGTPSGLIDRSSRPHPIGGWSEEVGVGFSILAGSGQGARSRWSFGWSRG